MQPYALDFAEDVEINGSRQNIRIRSRSLALPALHIPRPGRYGPASGPQKLRTADQKLHARLLGPARLRQELHARLTWRAL